MAEFKTLPDELVKLIIKACDPETRRQLASVSKKYWQLFHQCGLEFTFYIRGRTDRVLEYGFRHLLTTKYPVERVYVFKYDSRTLFKHDAYSKLRDGEECFSNPDIKTATLRECIVTIEFLERLEIMFPNLIALDIDRCVFTRRHMALPDCDSSSGLKWVQLTNPIIALDIGLVERLFTWYKDVDEKISSSSTISDNRWVKKSAELYIRAMWCQRNGTFEFVIQ